MTTERGAQDVVLLHGWGSTARVWQGLQAQLARRFRVRVPALPGYGPNSAGSPYNIDTMVDAIARNAPSRCHVVGWSLGGLATLAWAARSPEQVDRLAIIAATPCFVQRPGWPSAVSRETFSGFAGAVASDRIGALRRFVTLQVRGDSRGKQVATELRACLAPDAAALEDSLRVLLDTDLRDRLASLQMPVLALYGDRDELVPPAAVESLCRLLPRARSLSVAGAAHAPFLSNPAAVADALQDFFDE